MQATDIIDVLTRALPGDPARFQPLDTGDGMPTILVAPEALVDACRVLRDDPVLRFAFLADILPIDFHPREPRFEVNYLVASLGVAGFGNSPKRLRLKVRLSGEDPHLPTVSGVWPAADWAEREAYDFYGLQIDGHPDLRRLLMPDDWEGFPMRKDYPVQIKEPVKVRWPLQVSEEEFIANIEAARERARED
jgi:NADH-quinone oxidoreductase subunit C